jgi:hypothetical protein
LQRQLDSFKPEEWKMKSKTNTEQVERFVTIERLERAQIKLFLLGTTALVMNRMAAKARQQLLLPGRKKNQAEREQTQKHNPPFEFRDSIYRCQNDNSPTLVHMPNGAFKGAMETASLEIAGIAKTQVERLVKIIDQTVHIYGKPFLYMDVVRQAGISRTPDIRTRAMFPEWCCSITIQYIKNRIREQDIVNLVDAAGQIIGIGDGRNEKGAFDRGAWEIVNQNDPAWNRIAKNGGRKIQEAAMAQPEAVDNDSEELLAWYSSEIVRREKQKSEPKAILPKRKRNGGDDAIAASLS